jgi:hypothetical protein
MLTRKTVRRAAAKPTLLDCPQIHVAQITRA